MANLSIENRSKELLTNLTEGLDFSIPNVNFNDPAFQIPEALANALQNVPEPVTIKLLTEGTIDGKGVFDEVMRSMSAHLTREYDKGRITGSEYTKAYIACVQSGLQFATQYALGKDTAYYQALGTLAQSLRANIDAYTAKVQLAIAQAQAHTTKAQYANAVLGLSATEKQVDHVNAQTLQVGAQTSLVNAETAQMPVKTEQIEAQTAHTTAQTGQVIAQTGMIPAQTDSIKAQTAHVTAQTGMVPIQSKQIEAQTELVNAQTITQGKQQALIHEQTEQAHAQVSDTMLDRVTPVSGYTGNQNNLLKQQRIAFKQDAIVKGTKVFTDSFATQLSMSQATVAGTGLDAQNINKAVTKLQESIQNNDTTN